MGLVLFGWSEHELREWYGTLPPEREDEPVVAARERCPECGDEGYVELCCGAREGCEGECRVRVPCTCGA